MLIPYYLPIDTKEAQIVIRDFSGTFVKRYKLLLFDNYIELTMNELESGVYFYTLIVNGKSSSTKRMVKIK